MTPQTSKSRDLLAIAFAILLPTIVTLIYFVLLADSPANIQQTAYAIGKVIQFGFPIVYIWLFHRQRLTRTRTAENSPSPKSNSWLLGIGFGVLVVAAMFGAWFLVLVNGPIAATVTEAVTSKIGGMGLNSPWKFLALGLFYAIGHSFLEEYYWRWFVFDRLKHFTSTTWANVISSFGFAAHHVLLLATFFGWGSPLTWLFSLGVAVGGMVWAWLYQRSGKLAIPWVSHLIVDAGIFALGFLIAKSLFQASVG